MDNSGAFERIEGDFAAGLVLLGDHATRRLPDDYGHLGLPHAAFERHIAYDIGIEPLLRRLCQLTGAPGVMSCFSRLLIDPNRGEDDPTLIMRISDGAIIPGNHPITPDEWQRRIARFHRPYHMAVDRLIRQVEAAHGAAPLVISLHSFTPAWKGVPRPWEAAVLWDSDDRVARPLIEALEAQAIHTGDNEPYDGALKGDTLYRHCMMRGLPHALIEIRQDKIGDAAGVEDWAQRLAPLLMDLNRRPDLHRHERHASRTGPYPATDELESKASPDLGKVLPALRPAAI
ncbi:N-formylglutamate amidohydrolase [Rhizobium rhizosphaerae]|uniref:N-formylglutamate amidohydrolase n=1 Tax=Xaviernesmea rhizosphaerae TaxID=1672749 RepID=A0A1Q9AF69_9HYPH|nr:N-formylglutamate amidohydrolase [Xaviernesmea rhizosphaerae]OLP53574.1 N-formylglutamate amidohydrolase [Xaviernesmea rhizosphaerae]